MNKKIIFLCVILSVITCINLVFAQEAGGGGEPSPLPSGGSDGIAANYSVPYVDPNILEEFNKSSEVSIVVELQTKNITKVDEILATLSESDFKLKRKLPLGNGFGGNITKKGFEKLVNNPDVKFVWTDIIVSARSVDEGVNESEKEVIKNYKNYSISEKEQEFKVLNKTLQIKESEKSERKKIFAILITILVVALVISTYLIIKFKNNKKWIKEVKLQ